MNNALFFCFMQHKSLILLKKNLIFDRRGYKIDQASRNDFLYAYNNNNNNNNNNNSYNLDRSVIFF